MQRPAPATDMPPGISNAYFFQICNATSWSLILGTPMLLYLKNLGASGLIMGITVALIPLFGVLQIPAANYADRIGYKKFVVRGWTSRSIFILGIVVAALLPAAVEPRTRITLILIMLALFATARGISLCGYLPWITQVVPEPVRGTFISRDTTCMYLAITGTMLLSSAWVKLFPATRLFGGLFLLSYLAAMCSLIFLKRMPDVPTETGPKSRTHPPWGAMIRYPPFWRYLVYSVALNVFVAALGVLWVPYMRDHYGASGSLILSLSAYANILAAGASLLTGRLADRFGSRPLMGLSSALIILAQCLWMALAAGAITPHPLVPYGIISFGSTGFAIFGVANTRLLMGLVPAMGRSHFFAISSVAGSLTLGIFPILWGLALDAAEHGVPPGLSLGARWSWNAYSLLYASAVVGLLATQFLRHRLDEPRAISTEEFLRLLLIESPARLVARALNPLRRFLPPG